MNVSVAMPRAENLSVAALIEGRGFAKGEVGLAVYNLKNPVLYLYQFAETQTYLKLITKLNTLNPLEIILPSTICDLGRSSRLLKQISENCQNLKIVCVDRRYFNDQKGMQNIRKLSIPDVSAFEFQVTSKYYCVAAANALLKYVEFFQNIEFSPSSLKFIFNGNGTSAVIDFTTVKSIELIRNSINSKSRYSLYGILNATKTNMGARLLRSNLLEPLTDLDTLNDRLDLVEEFLENLNLYQKVRYALGKFPDVENLISVIIRIPKVETLKTAENKLSLLILLKVALESVDALKDALRCSRCEMLRNIFNILCDEKLHFIRHRIISVIDGGSFSNKNGFTSRVQRGFAIRIGVNELLDISRRTYSEAIDDINQLVKQLSEKYRTAFKSGYTPSRGFYLQMLANGKKLKELPSEFLKPLKYKRSILFTTYEMMFFNERIKDSLNEIYILSGKIAETVLHEIRIKVSCLHKLAECIAILDMVSCFAFNCINSPLTYVRPEFTNTMAVKGGRHPILEKLRPSSYVPNDMFASECCNFNIIEGPNMSGKSTYLSQIVLLQIMAQIGSFVPADAASFKITGHIFSRIGNELAVDVNISTFMSEIKEMDYILHNASKSSLIIIDELCRGSSAKYSVALCQAICENLLHTKAFTFLVTHYRHLTTLSEYYPSIETYNFKVIQFGNYEVDHIIFTYGMVKGKMTNFFYGIHLAKISTIQQVIPDEACQICTIIKNYKEKYTRCQPKDISKKTVFKLFKTLETLCDYGSVDEQLLQRNLVNLKTKCIIE